VDNSETISCRELHVIDDDASVFAGAEAEFVPASLPQRSDTRLHTPMRPTEEDKTAARDCWLKVISRFAKARPGKKGLLRVREGVTDQPTIVIRRAQPLAGTVSLRGEELDVTDKTYLVLFATETDTNGTRIVSSAVPWFEIESIAFRLRPPEDATAEAS
jgi:hypothetical protein